MIILKTENIIEVLNKINKEQNIIIVTSIEAVKQKIISKKNLYKNMLRLHCTNV